MTTPYTLSKVRLFKAVLPIMIVLHHLSFFYGSPPGFARLGLPLVACFFLMSGYGLMTSYMNKGQKYFQGFIAHVFNKLLIPYLVAVIVYVPFILFVQQVNVLEYLSTTSFIDWLRFSWFVWVISTFLPYFQNANDRQKKVKPVCYRLSIILSVMHRCVRR